MQTIFTILKKGYNLLFENMDFSRCIKCNHLYNKTNPKEIEIHEHKKMRKCTKCDQEYDKTDQLEMEKHAYETKCSKCNEFYDMRNTNDVNKHKNEVECQKCQTIYDHSIRELEYKHMNEILCDVCGMIYDKHDCLAIAKHKTEIKCTICQPNVIYDSKNPSEYNLHTHVTMRPKFNISEQRNILKIPPPLPLKNVSLSVPSSEKKETNLISNNVKTDQPMQIDTIIKDGMILPIIEYGPPEAYDDLWNNIGRYSLIVKQHYEKNNFGQNGTWVGRGRTRSTDDDYRPVRTRIINGIVTTEYIDKPIPPPPVSSLPIPPPIPVPSLPIKNSSSSESINEKSIKEELEMFNLFANNKPKNETVIETAIETIILKRDPDEDVDDKIPENTNIKFTLKKVKNGGLGEPRFMEIPSSFTVLDLKNRLVTVEDLPTKWMRLIYAGTELRDECPMKKYNFTINNVVFLAINNNKNKLLESKEMIDTYISKATMNKLI